jgi:hypothetical protein
VVTLLDIDRGRELHRRGIMDEKSWMLGHAAVQIGELKAWGFKLRACSSKFHNPAGKVESPTRRNPSFLFAW